MSVGDGIRLGTGLIAAGLIMAFVISHLGRQADPYTPAQRCVQTAVQLGANPAVCGYVPGGTP